MENEKRPFSLTDWLGLRRPLNLGASRTLGGFFGFILVLIALAFALLFLLSLGAAFFLVFGVFEDNPGSASLGLGALLVALLGAPFLIWRTVVAQQTLEATQKQTALQDEALFNDKINAAAKDLAARRQVTRPVTRGGSYTHHHDVWEDDLVTRAAAIDRLEGLAKEAIDRGDFPAAQRIARMLSIYVQELSREYPARPAPEYESFDQIQDWTTSLRPVPRPDMERAAQALGKIAPENREKRARFNAKDIDLRLCNLQGFDLVGLDYQAACLDGAHLEGARLAKTDFRSASFVGAKLHGALCALAQMQNADLSWARLQAADLAAAHLTGVTLEGTDLRSARLWGSKMQSAYLRGTRLEGTEFYNANVEGALFYGTLMSSESVLYGLEADGAAITSLQNVAIDQFRPYWHWIFADGTTDIGRAPRPAHWKDEKLNKDPLLRAASDDFNTAWRAWAAEAHPDVTIAPDWPR